MANNFLNKFCTVQFFLSLIVITAMSSFGVENTTLFIWTIGMGIGMIGTKNGD